MSDRSSQQLRRTRGWTVKQSRTAVIALVALMVLVPLLYRGRSYSLLWSWRSSTSGSTGSNSSSSTSSSNTSVASARRPPDDDRRFSNARRDVCSDKPAAVHVFTADEKSLSQHAVPEWFERARFGIFIHWGLYSVPGWAETKHSFEDFKKTVSPEQHFMHNPYSEWYLNTVRMNQAAAAAGKTDAGAVVGDALEHHKKTFHEDPANVEPGQWYYSRFAKAFNDGLKDWKPQEWAELFKDSGAGYVVLTTKHHDGYCLWPTKAKHPLWGQFAGKQGLEETHVTQRDLVGELTKAVRAVGLQMGLYYSGGLDWSFHWQLDKCFDDPTGKAKCHPDVPVSKDYALYAGNQLSELMEAYKPAILWNDINWPAPGKHDAGDLSLPPLFATYFNKVCQKGIINDRWKLDVGEKKWSWSGDFGTPEYGNMNTVQSKVFETCRGIGKSFGFNRAEEESEKCSAYMSAAQVVKLLITTAAKNGNLLLDVGPDENGQIPKCQASVLRDVGHWLRTYGKAVVATVPFLPAGSAVNESDPVRYFQSVDGTSVYAVVLAGAVRKSAATEKKYVTLLDAPKVPRLSSKFRPEATVWLPSGTTVLVATESSADSLTVFLPWDKMLPKRDEAWVIEFSHFAPAAGGKKVLDCRKLTSCATLVRK